MKAWEQFLSKLEGEWGQEAVQTWLRPLKVVRFDAGNLHLQVEDPIQGAWFAEHVAPRIKRKELCNENHRPIKVHLHTGEEKKGKSSLPVEAPLFPTAPLDPLLSLETFVRSEENSMACRFMEELSLQGTSPFNPLFLHGPPQSGKTHLLMGAASRIRKKALFVNADTFTEHVVQAIRKQKMQAFRALYRDIDLLFVDDVDRLARRMATQEEFFHTFNTLHTLGKQIVLSSQVPPSQLEEIEPRLTSRFEWGLVLSLTKADPALILRSKAKACNVPLSAELEGFLLSRLPSNPIAGLQTLFLRGAPPYPLLAVEKLLADLLAKEGEKKLTPEKIVKALSAHFGIKTEDLLGRTQTREFVLPRQIGIYLCRESLKMTLEAIGRFFGRDHSTVKSSIEQVAKRIAAKQAEVLEAIERTI